MTLPIRFAGRSGDVAAPVISVDGSFGAGPDGLHLAHWPGNRTPAALRRDLSTEIAFAYLDLPGDERRALARGCSALSVNHYDTDGVCALFALTRPGDAAAHRELLVQVAAAGDLHAVRCERALAIDAALRAFADPGVSPGAAARAGEDELARKQRLVEGALDLLGRLLDDETAARDLWQPELDAYRADRADLDAALFDDLVYLDLGVWTAPLGRTSTRAAAPPAFDPGRHAFFGDERVDRALLLGPGEAGTTARFVVGTWSFFDVVSRRPSARPDLEQLAAALNAEEGRPTDERWAWRHQPQGGATPELWFGTAELPLYAEHAGSALGRSTLAPETIKRAVLDAVRDAWELPHDDDEANEGEDIFAV